MVDLGIAKALVGRNCPLGVRVQPAQYQTILRLASSAVFPPSIFRCELHFLQNMRPVMASAADVARFKLEAVVMLIIETL
jgi:hypothetical protein